MGMYTELIIGCRLKEETPDDVIATIKWMLSNNDGEPEPKNLPGKGTRIRWMFRSDGSYYFGCPACPAIFAYDKIAESYRLAGRFNIKNYKNEIESFLDWLEPWVAQGSGSEEIWAMHIYEESPDYTIRKLGEQQ